MKSTKFLILLFLSSLIISSCGESAVSCSEEKADAKSISETRTLSGFSGIKLNTTSSVNIKHAEKFKISIHGKPKTVNRLSTTVKDNEITIDFAQPCEFNTETIVSIEMPTLTSLKLNGSGGINVSGPFRDSDLEINNTGSGNIGIDGFSHFKSNNINLVGSGTVDAFKSVCDQSKVNSTGSGKVKVSPLNTLDVISVGSGNVIYSGDTSLQINFNLTGTGKLMKYSK